MKKILPAILLYLCFISVYGQKSVRDTVFVYETVIVYDTIIIKDTIRVKKEPYASALQHKSINLKIFETSSKKILISTATFPKNRIILHEKHNKYKHKKVKNMKFNVSKNVSAIILTAQSIAGLTAQETRQADDLKSFPAQISFVYPMSSMGNETVNYSYNFSLNMLTGRVGAVNGIEVGGLYNHAELYIKGAQISGLINKTADLKGAQIGGLANFANNAKGLQCGGLINITQKAEGAQIAGLVNFSDSNTGIQIGGIANFCNKSNKSQIAGIVNMSESTTGSQIAGYVNMSESTTGSQIAGIANITEKCEGFQCAGIVNISKEIKGTSIAGVYNRTGTLSGFQLGLVNVIDSVENGFSLALITVAKNNFYQEWQLSFADYLNVAMSYKMGMKNFYTIFTAGANFIENDEWVLGFGFGLGYRAILNHRFDFQPEVVGYQYYPINYKHIQYTNSAHLKFGFVYKINEKLGITVAPSLYHLYYEKQSGKQECKVSPVKEFFEHKYKNHINKFGAGFSVGIIFR